MNSHLGGLEKWGSGPGAYQQALLQQQQASCIGATPPRLPSLPSLPACRLHGCGRIQDTSPDAEGYCYHHVRNLRSWVVPR